MKRLIVNADDFGAGEKTDQGILEAFQRGVVTSASLLANGQSFLHAVRSARLAGLPVGVHLNLSEGQAVAGPVSGLTDESGRFPGKETLRRLLAESPPAPGPLFRELAAQVEKVLSAGLKPDHLDTHQHFFLFPAATEVVLDVARAFALRALRLPLNAEKEEEIPSPLESELTLYRRLAPTASRALKRKGFLTPDGLLGMSSLNRLDEERLAALLDNIPPGTWELMVHPGHLDPLNPFSSPRRVSEMAALLSPLPRQIIRSRGIRLITFGELS